MEKEVFIGVDVSKDRLEVGDLSSGEVFGCGNSSLGIEGLIQPLVGLNPTLLVCEATGGYELDLVIAAELAGLPMVVTKLPPIFWVISRAKINRELPPACGYCSYVEEPFVHLIWAQLRSIEPALQICGF